MSDDTIARLRSEAAAARDAGDGERQAAALEELAAAHVDYGQLEEAKKRLREAAAVHDRDGRTDRAAKATYGVGVLEARTPGAPAARRELTRALDGFTAAGDDRMAGRTQVQLALVALGADDTDEADARLAAAAQAFAHGGDDAAAVSALRARSLALQVLDRVPEALDALTEAIAIAERAGSPAELLALRLDVEGLAAGEDPHEDALALEAILLDAVHAGDRGAALRARLARAGQALAAGRFTEAAADAGAAREDALALVDPVGYLTACLLLSETAERQGDHVGALTILFTCRASLADLLGEAGGEPVLALVDALRERWGDAAFDIAMRRYREQFED